MQPAPPAASGVEMIEAVSRTPLFKNCSPSELRSILAELKSEHYQAGDIILREGDLGDRLHILLSGSVRVYTNNEAGDEIVLARLEKGAYFGEQALLFAKPIRRSASVRALTDVGTGTLTHATFQKHLRANENLRELLLEVGRDELILKITSQLKDQAAQDLEIGRLFKQIRRLERREVMFRQGDPADYACFLLSGSVGIRIYGDDARLKSHVLIQPGQLFGDLGVLEKQPRAGTAVALSDSQVAVVQADTLEEFSRENARLRSLITSQRSLYQIPASGLVMQYQGELLGKPALHTTVQKVNGDLLTISRMVNTDVVSMAYPNRQPTHRESFADTEEHFREILLDGNRLVGSVTVGAWDDLPALYINIYHQPEVSKRALESFRESGRLDLSVRSSARDGHLCECMQVKTDVVQKLILEGLSSLEAISRKTGAGTVCGGCRPRIIELTGGSAWTYVRIVNIREHNATIRSYQLQPVKGRCCSCQAGQHIVLEGNIDGLWVARSYTLTALDEAANIYEVTIKRETQGYFSNWLFLHDREPVHLRVSEPQGTFIFKPEIQTPAVCLMAGIGITPAIAFARALTASQEARPLYIDYSVHSEEEMAFGKELADWPRQWPNISTHTRVTAREGHLGESELGSLLSRNVDADVYICGPARYEAAMKTILTAARVPAERTHLEQFAHAGAPVAG
jgi:ferredoxin-NADP reductase/CRP-like cAMP-binding protein/bacterioferritin-associated ferredoxin